MSDHAVDVPVLFVGFNRPEPPCEVRTQFQDTIIGCRFGVQEALDWFFDNVESGIVLKDDCAPDPTF